MNITPISYKRHRFPPQIIAHAVWLYFRFPLSLRLVEETLLERCIANEGRLRWQASTGYGKRALIETAIGRYKGLIGRRLRARSFPAQQTEAAIGCAVINRMLDCARPGSVRCPARPI